MAPPKDASSKAEMKAKQKLVEDKTFGLKNKNKSTKVSKYVSQVEQSILGQKKRSDEAAKAAQDRAKKEEEEKSRELSQLMKPVIVQPKIPFGTDPKSVLCVHFKAGCCSKGDKCKFSHDLGIERKMAKPDIYTDARDAADPSKQADTMDSWDQTKLEQVIAKKHGMKPATDIVCKHFIEAVENSRYGWFWECPNGGDRCHYRHALPPGYVLRSKGKSVTLDSNDASGEGTISLEEFLEEERRRLGDNLTPLTVESFAAWKQAKKEKALQEEQSRLRALETQKKGVLASGRDLFLLQPDLFQADDEEALEIDYTAREEEVDIIVSDESLFSLELGTAGLSLSSDSE